MTVTMQDMALLADLEYEMFVQTSLEEDGGADVDGMPIANEILRSYFMKGVEWGTTVDETVTLLDIKVEEEVISFNIMSDFSPNDFEEAIIAKQIANAAQVVFGYGAAWCIEHRKHIGDLGGGTEI